jgi:hypothetical protein
MVWAALHVYVCPVLVAAVAKLNRHVHLTHVKMEGHAHLLALAIDVIVLVDILDSIVKQV